LVRGGDKRGGHQHGPRREVSSVPLEAAARCDGERAVGARCDEERAAALGEEERAGCALAGEVRPPSPMTKEAPPPARALTLGRPAVVDRGERWFWTREREESDGKYQTGTL